MWFWLKKRLEILFSLANVNSFNDLDKHLLNLKKRANLESDFNRLGINRENSFSRIMSGINILRLSNNPVDLDHNDIKNEQLNRLVLCNPRDGLTVGIAKEIEKKLKVIHPV